MIGRSAWKSTRNFWLPVPLRNGGQSSHLLGSAVCGVPRNCNGFGNMQETPRINTFFSVAPAIYPALCQNAGKTATLQIVTGLGAGCNSPLYTTTSGYSKSGRGQQGGSYSTKSQNRRPSVLGKEKQAVVLKSVKALGGAVQFCRSKLPVRSPISCTLPAAGYDHVLRLLMNLPTILCSPCSLKKPLPPKYG